jgi:ribonuclease PH
MSRHDGRRATQLRELKIKRRYTRSAPGSALITAGSTVVLCTASVEESVPPWLKEKQQGWVTAEYGMLPGSTSPRKSRDRGGKIDGRTTEIQRLIGRSLRAVVNMAALGPRTITIDCDVIEADGGTRTASITGAYVALVDAVRSFADAATARSILRDSVAAVSVGIVEGTPVLDLDYAEDSEADVDMNVVLTGGGKFVEIQGTGEQAVFDENELAAMLKLARGGLRDLMHAQRDALGKAWPFA